MSTRIRDVNIYLNILFYGASFLRKIIFVTIILLISVISYSQESIGVVEIDYNENTVIQLFDKIDGDTVYSLSFSDTNEDIIPYNKSRYEEITWLQPEFGHIFDGDGYVSLFVLRCKRLVGNWMEIYIDRQYIETCWLYKSEVVKLKTWEEFLKDMLIIHAKDADYKVYSSPSKCSNHVNYKGENCFKVLELKNNWIKVIPYLDCVGDLRLHEDAIGWIQWQNEDTLLIKYEPW